MDPAILSFRQYSSFPHQAQMPLHQQQQDLFLQHLAQNQQQQNGQGKSPSPPLSKWITFNIYSFNYSKRVQQSISTNASWYEHA